MKREAELSAQLESEKQELFVLLEQERITATDAVTHVKMEMDMLVRKDSELQAQLEEEKHHSAMLIEQSKQLQVFQEAQSELLAQLEYEKQEITVLLEQERVAKLEAEKQAKLEAEARAKKEDELVARLEHEKQQALALLEQGRVAKLEAEKQVQMEAEKHAKNDEELRAQLQQEREARLQVKAGAEARATIDTELLVQLEEEKQQSLNLVNSLNAKLENETKNLMLYKEMYSDVLNNMFTGNLTEATAPMDKKFLLSKLESQRHLFKQAERAAMDEISRLNTMESELLSKIEVSKNTCTNSTVNHSFTPPKQVIEVVEIVTDDHITSNMINRRELNIHDLIKQLQYENTLMQVQVESVKADVAKVNQELVLYKNLRYEIEDAITHPLTHSY
jgi:hypothetical protein